MTPTSRVRYSTGPWLGLVRGRRLVALPADASEETAAIVWDLLAGAPGVEQLLATVLSGRLDLTGMPSFAIVSFEGQTVHAFLRGDVHLRMTGPGSGQTRLSGTGVSTWNERVIPDVRTFELRVDDAVPAAENLPLDAGAVRLSALSAELPAAPGDAGEKCAGEEDPAQAAEHGPGETRDIEMTMSPEAADAAAAPPSGREPAPVAEPRELIDSVPWLAAARGTVPGPAPTDTPARPEHHGRTAQAPTDLGATVAPDAHRDAHPDAHVDDEADADTVLSPSAAAAGPATGPGGGDDPDHDGQTVMRSELDVAGVGTPAPATPPLPATTGPLVLARQCSDGHASPPTSTTCLVCGESLSGEARQVRRPALGRIRMSTGEVLELDRPAVIGRQPQARRVASGTMPRMIQVRSPHGDISRSHCEVVLEGWHVQLRDLKATNGTILVREGQSPRRLGQGESVMVLDGDIADLGDGVSLRFEAIP